MGVPKRKRMIGHAKTHDVYETPRGNIYLYRGTKKEHWSDSRYWKKVKK